MVIAGHDEYLDGVKLERVRTQRLVSQNEDCKNGRECNNEYDEHHKLALRLKPIYIMGTTLVINA